MSIPIPIPRPPRLSTHHGGQALDPLRFSYQQTPTELTCAPQFPHPLRFYHSVTMFHLVIRNQTIPYQFYISLLHG